MIINTKAIEELINGNISAYEIEKETGVSRVTINEIRKGERKMQNVPLKNLEKLQTYINKEEMEMKEQNLIEELKNNYDVIGGLEDVYYQPSTKTFWLVESGMAYSGDDPDAVEIAQIEDGEIIRTTVELDEVEF